MSKPVLLRIATLLALAGFDACRAPATRSDVEGVLRAYETAYNAHDAHGLAAVHAHDGRYAVADGPIVEGRQAIETFWSRIQGRGLKLELLAYETSGDVGWALGTWSGQPGPDGFAAHGRFVLALRREDGQWKIAVDINNDAGKR
jgi:ketosteroid isomerase-like protein